MPLRVGQPVAAAHTLGALGDIRRGTPGVVVGVSYLGAYDVKFLGGRVVRGLSSDQLIARSPGLGLVGSGCLLRLVAAMLLAAASALIPRTGLLARHLRCRLRAPVLPAAASTVGIAN